MNTYKYLRLNYSTHKLLILSTDTQTLDWIVDEVKKKSPSCEVSQYGSFAEFDNFHGEILQIPGWIIKELCEKGWEPFAAHGSENIYFDGDVHFKYFTNQE